jgi:cob(I)alamin adenosyltransferase
MKGQRYGELDAAKMLYPYMTIEQYGKDTFIHVQNPPHEDDVLMARQGLAKGKEATLSGKYDIVIFDEITAAHFFHLISVQDMTNIIESKPDGVELIFSGRYAPPGLIEAASLVTEMTEVKHYYQMEVLARGGIER